MQSLILPELKSFSLCNLQKSRRRRNRKKKKKKKSPEKQEEEKKKEAEKTKEPEVEIEYVTEEPEIYDPNFIFFKRIFEAFKVSVYILVSQSGFER